MVEKQIVAQNQWFVDEQLLYLHCHAFGAGGTWTFPGHNISHLSDGARGILFMAFTLVLVPLTKHTYSS